MGVTLERAVSLSRMGAYPDAHALFERLELAHQASDAFYASWILNYASWSASFEDDATMYSFVLEYRNRAIELLSSASQRFPGSQELADAHRTVHSPSVSVEQTKGGCFVATAVYGDAGAPEVELLREWRDRTLSRYVMGRAFIAAYYRRGPALARLVVRRRSLTLAARLGVGAIVAFLRMRKGAENWP